MYIEASSPRQYGDIARLISPQFMWKNVANCKVGFFCVMCAHKLFKRTLFCS